MANPGKPAEQKRRTGSRHYKPADDLIMLEKVSSMPVPLRRLGDSGLALWNRTWQMGQVWLSANTDIELLQMTCEQLDERDLLLEYVLANTDDCRFERSALRELDKSIRTNLSLMGFTPTNRMKLGVAEVKRMSLIEEMMTRDVE